MLKMYITACAEGGGTKVGTTTAKSTGKTTPIKKVKVKVTPRGGNAGTGGKTTRG